MNRTQIIIKALLFFHMLIGGLWITYLIFGPSFIIGSGHFEKFVGLVENFSFRWPIIVVSFSFWILPIFLVLGYFLVRGELDRVKAVLETFMENKTIPVHVDLDNTIPIEMDRALEVPVEINTSINFHETVKVKANIPIKLSIPFETNIETSVLGLGKISIPIRSTVPLDFNFPFEDEITIDAPNVPINLKETTLIKMPPFEVPLKTRIKTNIHILSNIRGAIKNE
ncbi:MAG: hypothetical protein HN509_18785 [Halobacteriovoraceae bacterium]|jgi:hypothetical protein|nr:hypothetical protein [Halobacteriovoraceae bacterium]MBT5095730.1 hypothetical protein [Halobacteriovoraceae bacterium]